MKNKLIYTLLIILILACKDNKNRTHNELIRPLKVHRFEQDLFTLDTAKITEGLTSLFIKYPVFARVYFGQIMGFSDNFDSLGMEFYTIVKEHITDSFNLVMMNTINEKYKNISHLIREFEKTQAQALHHLPLSKRVELFTMYSGFNVGNIIFSNTDSTDGLGISLEYFLGSDFDYKSMNPEFSLFSDYLTRTFNTDHILKKSWVPFADDVISKDSLNDFLDHMVYEGKKLYLIKQIIPNISDSILFEFSDKQVNWCKRNRMDIWAFIKDSKLINSNKKFEIGRYLNPAPTSPGMPSESPGRTCIFTGYEIVYAFMEEHPKLKLIDLIMERDAQKILNGSMYKPKNEN